MNEWISVEERLPEKGVCVLLYLNSENEQAMTTGKICKSDEEKYDGEFCIGFDFIDPGFLKRECVKYWMPLPEPPRT